MWLKKLEIESFDVIDTIKYIFSTSNFSPIMWKSFSRVQYQIYTVKLYFSKAAENILVKIGRI